MVLQSCDIPEATGGPTDELWNLTFFNVGHLHCESKSQRDVSRAIQAISGIGPPTNQQCQRTTGCANTISARRCPLGAGGVRVAPPAAHASQSDSGIGSVSKTFRESSGTCPSSSYRYVRWQPSLRGQGGTAANNAPHAQHNYQTSHVIPGLHLRPLYGAGQPWRLGR
jgi:hypothetical protein